MKINYYCLSLEKYRNKRFLITKKESFDKHSIPIIEFNGIDGQIFNSNKELADKYNLKLGGKMNKCSPILISIAQSHRNIWKNIIENKSVDYNIIFEDDILIKCENFKNKVSSIISKINKLKKPNIILLGYLYVNKILDDNQVIKETNNFAGLQAYLIDRNTAKFLYENTFYLSDQIDVVISDYLNINKYYLVNKLVEHKNIESIAHNQRNIFLEKYNCHILSRRIGINFKLSIGTGYHINMTFNTLLNVILGFGCGKLTLINHSILLLAYFFFNLLEIFYYGGVIFINFFEGVNQISKYDDDEVVNKIFDIIIFSLIIIFSM